LRSGTAAGGYQDRQNITYDYNAAGNLLTIIDAAAYNGDPPTPPATQTQTFSYDTLNRLVTAEVTGGNYGTYPQRSYAYSNAGNITSFEGAAYAYNDAAHKHAVTHVGTPPQQRYWYDANGNVTRRITPWGTDISLEYDAENRLTRVTNTSGGSEVATYAYDGDGQRVKAVVNGTTSVYVGAYYEVTGGVVKKYYYAGSVRVAERNGGVLYFLLSDHLGSTAVTTDASGNRVTELRYKPLRQAQGKLYGDMRYNPGSQITTYRFTGQRWDQGHGLYWFNSRWFDPLIGRFMQADTIVPDPGNPQALNRYSYVIGNPLRYTDPTGHVFIEGTGGGNSTVIRAMAACLVSQPTSTPYPTSTPLVGPTATPAGPVMQAAPTWSPTPYAGPWMGPATPRPPTATPRPTPALGTINWPDKYWTLTYGLAVAIPEELTGEVLTHALGRAGTIVPGIGILVGIGASVGPNLYEHYTQGDPLHEYVTDVAVDLAGWGASQLTAGVGALVGAPFAAQTGGASVPVLALAGELGGSFAWDLWGAPWARPYGHDFFARYLP